MDQKLKTSDKQEPRSRLISCTRPDLTFTFAPQKGWPKAQGLCGHDIYQREQLMLGDLIVSKPNKNRFGEVERDFGYTWEKCYFCRAGTEFEYAIVCAKCGRIIFRGQPVSLYETIGGTAGNPFYKHATRTLIGDITVNCMDWECCPSPGFYSGLWHGVGILTTFITGTLVGDMFAGHTKKAELIKMG